MNPEGDESTALLLHRIDSLEKLLTQRIEGGWNEIKARFEAEAKALQLQGKEYERRLEVLNNDREEARRKEASFLPRDLWDEYVKSAQSHRESLGMQINDLRTQKIAEHATFATKEYVDGQSHGLSAKVDTALTSISTRVDNLERASSNMSGRLWALGVSLTVLVILINWFVGFFKR